MSTLSGIENVGCDEEKRLDPVMEEAGTRDEKWVDTGEALGTKGEIERRGEMVGGRGDALRGRGETVFRNGEIPEGSDEEPTNAKEVKLDSLKVYRHSLLTYSHIF